jgi:tetratricopeptide (TPR) repeat protein
MMESQHAKDGHKAAEDGIEALHKRQRDVAARHFDTALEQFEAIEDDAERCRELGGFALMLDQLGFPDLALMAAQEAVALNEKLGDHAQMAEDLNTCGIAQMHLGNAEEALALYRQAFEIFKSKHNLANAASAYTNMALIIGNLGQMDEAIRMMYQSLDYLSQQAYPPTEIITRIALIQALVAEKRPPKDIFAVARPVARFASELRPDQWDGLRGPLKMALERYVSCHPGVDTRDVIRQYLPGLF